MDTLVRVNYMRNKHSKKNEGLLESFRSINDFRVLVCIRKQEQKKYEKIQNFIYSIKIES